MKTPETKNRELLELLKSELKLIGFTYFFDNENMAVKFINLKENKLYPFSHYGVLYFLSSIKIDDDEMVEGFVNRLKNDVYAYVEM